MPKEIKAVKSDSNFCYGCVFNPFNLKNKMSCRGAEQIIAGKIFVCHKDMVIYKDKV